MTNDQFPTTLFRECRGMLGQGTCLATQWASLSLSLAQLRATQPGQ